MRVLFIFLLFISKNVLADSDCFTKKEGEQFVREFVTSKDKYGFIKEISKKNQYMERFGVTAFDSLKKNYFIMDLATVSTFTWSKSKKDKDMELSQGKFPEGKLCVLAITMELPEKLRKMCDDAGAYGYFFTFQKENGTIKLFDINNMDVEFIDNGVNCPELNNYLARKNIIKRK